MKIKSLFLFILVVLMSALVAWGQKVGLLMDSYVVERWRTDQALFTERIKELGGKCIVEVPHGNAEEQVRLGKKLLAQKIDVLVIVPTDADVAVQIVEEAKKLKVPVISYDRMVASKDIDLYVSYDNYKVGRLQGEYMKGKVPSGNYLFLNGPTSDRNSILFRNGQMDALKNEIESGKINVIGDFILEDWSELESIMKVEQLLATTSKKPDVIVAANDALANGAMQVLPNDLLGRVLITGQDAERQAMRQIVTGNQSMTVYKPIRPLAYAAAESAMKLARKQKIQSVRMKVLTYEVNAILLDPVVVDKNNYRETVIKDGHLSLAEVDGQ